ncbi:MAG: 1,4-alpha-glucan branching protein GlgB [Bacilli bacterium]
MAYGLVYDYLNGQSIDAFSYFGAHFCEIKTKVGRKLVATKGVIFRLYAPLVTDVSVIGEFNSWDPSIHKMNCIDEAGIFELFIPNLINYQAYKFHFKNMRGQYVDKADPFAFFSEIRPNSSSRLFDIDGFIWHDKPFLDQRTREFDSAMSIYEMHVGSRFGQIDGRFLSYEEVAEKLIPYIKDNGFTHVELMPVCQYPFDGSWGYQATGFFSIDSRYGNPMQLMSFVDRLHQAGIGVIIDFAPVHFAIDPYGLIDFNGSHMYEGEGDRAYSQWGSCLFDLGKDPVRSFLMSSMNYFLSYFHFDGIRVDAVSNIIFYDGNKERGTWDGGVEFVKRLNGKIHSEHPTVMMIAEDSTDYLGTTHPLWANGLDFDYKWDLGWMNDTLKYYQLDPIYKKYDHYKLTFSMAYFYSENFLLPLSHDEVVHGKGTILNKMWGNYDTKFALLRNLYTYMFAHPGKKLNFMGNELGSWDEWDEKKSLPWNLKQFPKHDSVSRLLRDLNLIYRKEDAMNKEEYNSVHFNWLMANNADQSIFAFERRFGDSHLVFVFNMTPNFYEYFDIGINRQGTYVELLNSDKSVYGGNNQYNGEEIHTGQGGPEDKPFHITIKISAYAAMIFKFKKEN